MCTIAAQQRPASHFRRDPRTNQKSACQSSFYTSTDGFAIPAAGDSGFSHGIAVCIHSPSGLNINIDRRATIFIPICQGRLFEIRKDWEARRTGCGCSGGQPHVEKPSVGKTVRAQVVGGRRVTSFSRIDGSAVDRRCPRSALNTTVLVILVVRTMLICFTYRLVLAGKSHASNAVFMKCRLLQSTLWSYDDLRKYHLMGPNEHRFSVRWKARQKIIT
jgi:hypothetical protein